MANVPSVAVEALAEQVGLLPLALAASLQGYPASEDTRLDHHERLRRHLGFSRCGTANVSACSTTWRPRRDPCRGREMVIAAGHLLGFSLEPRIADLGDQTLYKIDREAAYPGLDPILTGTIKTHLIGPARPGTASCALLPPCAHARLHRR